MHDVGRDDPLRAHRRVEPVERRLAGLEDMEVDPSTPFAVGPDHDIGRGPITVLDARIVKDDQLQGPWDVSFVLKDLHRLRQQVDAVPAFRNRSEQSPVRLAYLYHRVQASVVLVGSLSEPEVRSFACVSRYQVANHGDARILRRPRHLDILLIRPEQRIDRQLDPVEEPVDSRRVPAAGDAAGTSHRTRVDALNPDLLECGQQIRAAQSLHHALTGTRYRGQGITGEPHRCVPDSVSGSWVTVRTLPLPRLSGYQAAQMLGLIEHRTRFEPIDVSRIFWTTTTVRPTGRRTRLVV